MPPLRHRKSSLLLRTLIHVSAITVRQIDHASISDPLPHRSRAALLSLLLWGGLIGALCLEAVRPASAQAVDGPLQRQHVRDYIRLRIETHQLQM